MITVLPPRYGRIGYAAGIAVLLATTGPSSAASDFFPNSSTQPISRTELDQLDCFGLWHARNEIFARNGYRFQTARGRAEFGTGGTTANPRLNPIEQANIAAIQSLERSYPCPS